MPSIPSAALPHLARVVATSRVGSRSIEGERAAIEDHGPWFPARRMSPRPTEDPADRGGRRRSEIRWVLLYGDEYDDGSPLTQPPRESDMVQVDRDGAITTYVVGATPRAFDDGETIFGGQVDLVEAGDSA
jgi:hypothetical protein